jgi:hypothetical protein
MLLPITKSVRARGQGFVEEVPVGLADESWRSDHDGRYGLRITSAGLKAIGVPALVSGLEQPTAPRPGSKLAKLITMLMEPDGRTVDELSQAMGWLPHTVRAAITGLRKGGHVVVRAKNDAGVSVYRIEAPAEATASDQDA